MPALKCADHLLICLHAKPLRLLSRILRVIHVYGPQSSVVSFWQSSVGGPAHACRERRLSDSLRVSVQKARAQARAGAAEIRTGAHARTLPTRHAGAIQSSGSIKYICFNMVLKRCAHCTCICAIYMYPKPIVAMSIDIANTHTARSWHMHGTCQAARGRGYIRFSLSLLSLSLSLCLLGVSAAAGRQAGRGQLEKINISYGD